MSRDPVDKRTGSEHQVDPNHQNDQQNHGLGIFGKDRYESKKPSTAIRELLKKMNDVRVRATKTEPLKTRTLANVTIPPEEVTPKVLAFLQAGATGQVQLEPIDPTNTVFLVKVNGDVLAKAHLKSAEHALPEFQGRDSKDVCREYLTELESLVTECHAKFKA